MCSTWFEVEPSFASDGCPGGQFCVGLIRARQRDCGIHAWVRLMAVVARRLYSNGSFHCYLVMKKWSPPLISFGLDFPDQLPLASVSKILLMSYSDV